MTSRAIVAISDLHMGKGTPGDSFVREQGKVTAFAEALASGAARAGAELTVVVNGDIFDLWEMIGPDELRDGDAAFNAITQGLLVPTETRPQLELLAANVRVRLRESLGQHREFPTFLNTLLDSGAGVCFTVGNHDHQLDNAAMVPGLRSELVDAGVARADRITVGRYYWDEALGFYAEHGDQFAGSDSHSPLNPVGGDRLQEAAGFYLLRYLWNRLEDRGYGLDKAPTIFQILGLLVKLLFGINPAKELRDFLHDYFRGKALVHFPLVEVRAGGKNVFQVLYDAWLKKNPPVQTLRGSLTTHPLDVADLQAVGDALAPAGEFESLQPEAVLELDRLPDTRFTATPAPSWLPGRDASVPKAAIDHYIEGLRSRFSTNALDFPVLERNKVHTVTIGHTHQPCQLRLFGDDGPAYFNSGSWTKGQDLTPYVWCFNDGASTSSGIRAAF